MNREAFSMPLEGKRVRITDAFWGQEQELVRKEVIPYQWEALNDRVAGAAPSYCMRNFKVAGKMMKQKREQGAAFVAPSYTYRGFEALPEKGKEPDPDKFYGFVFPDSDFSKWIEAVAYSLMNHSDERLERTADEAIDIVCAAQAENGYLDTYYIINGMDRIFTNLRDHHELYCFGHLAEGAIAYYQATGKDKLLRAAMRYADFIASRFGEEEGKCKGYPGHEIAEMALTRLYELTGEKSYLKLAKFFLDMRGQRPYYFDLEEEERAAYEGKPYTKPEEGELRFQYHQAHLPVREQSEAVGHAVRAVYLYSGMADVARLTGEEALFAACRRIWDSITKEKLYITGGIGGTHVGEAFSYPYDLPVDTAYSETCAAIGLVFFAGRMLRIEADSRYGDVMEQALYNTVLAGMALDGKSFFYVNPLEVVPEACERDERKRHVKAIRQKWFGCACCPPNIARLVSSVGAYAYTGNETTLYTHLYMGSRVQHSFCGKGLVIHTETNFPWEGDIRVAVHAKEVVQGTLAFRVPGWCKDMRFSVKVPGQMLTGTYEASGQCVLFDVAERSKGSAATGKNVDFDTVIPITGRMEKGYLYLTGEWQEGDEISLHFHMEVRCIRANPRVRENIGKVAFTRGPVCYCMEEADNGKNLHLLSVDMQKLYREAAECIETGGVTSANPTDTTDAVGTEKRYELQVEKWSALGHEMRILKIPGKRQLLAAGEELYTDYTPAKEEDVPLTLVPYYAWNNRGEGEMSVWVRA